jgi:hypothetical protein
MASCQCPSLAARISWQHINGTHPHIKQLLILLPDSVCQLIVKVGLHASVGLTQRPIRGPANPKMQVEACSACSCKLKEGIGNPQGTCECITQLRTATSIPDSFKCSSTSSISNARLLATVALEGGGYVMARHISAARSLKQHMYS